MYNEKNLLLTNILGSSRAFAWYLPRLCQHWWSVGVMWPTQRSTDLRHMTLRGTPLNHLLFLSKIWIVFMVSMPMFTKMLTYSRWLWLKKYVFVYRTIHCVRLLGHENHLCRIKMNASFVEHKQVWLYP